MAFNPRDPLGSDFVGAVGSAITTFLKDRQPAIDEVGVEVQPLLDQARHFTDGGKRFRPAFCYWGFAAAHGQPGDASGILAAAASLDLLHVSALVHDDVMDASDTRRGGPAAHVVNAELHRDHGWRGDAGDFGTAGAILLGDLLLMWSAQMWAESALPASAIHQAQPILDAVRTEVTLGQYLDIVAQHAEASLDRARRVTEFKSARYTIARPVQLGAALGGATPQIIDALGQFGSPIGRAFQLRDDLLGVYGNEAVTGKPTGGDLREGKRTVLVNHALTSSAPDRAARLEALLGDPSLDGSQIAEAQQIIADSGAVDRVEADIVADHETAMTALASADINEEARVALAELARLAVTRTF